MATETEVIAEAGNSDTPATTGIPGNEAVETPESKPAVETATGEEPVTDEDKTPPAADAGKKPEPSVEELKTIQRAITKERDAWKKQAKAAEARYEPPKPPAATGRQDAGAIDPLLAGRAYDSEDETVEYAPGRWFPKEQARSMARADHLFDQSQQGEVVKQAARLAEDRNDIYKSVEKSVSNTVKAAFPNLSDKALSRRDKIVDESFVQMLRENRIPMDFDPADLPADFPELTKAAIVRGLEWALEDVVELQNPTKTKQAIAAALQPVPPGGTAAAPAPKRYSDMTDEEQYKDKRSIADRILRRHPEVGLEA